MAVHTWTWQFTKLLHTIMTAAFASKSPTYTKIMELDKRVRDFPDPECIQGGKNDDVTKTMQHLLVTLYKESSTFLDRV